MFFGGLFAYDLVAGFEDLPRCKATPPARTTASIWRKPAGSIDHQNTRIQASLFTPLESEKQRLEQRIAQLRQQMNEPPAPLPVTTVESMRR
jgi:anthranilate synthase component 1